MTQAAVVIGGFAIAVAMWRVAAVLEPVKAEPVPETRRGRWWTLVWVSAASAISAAAMAQLMSARPATAAFVLFAAACPGLAWLDVRLMLLPFPILAVLALAALAVFGVDAWWSGSAGHLGRAVLSGLVVAVLGWMWWKAAGDGVGLGDVALLGVVGLYLGWFSVVAVWAGLAIVSVLALVAVALARIGCGRRPAGSLVPLGPPILAGWWAATALAATGGL
jgi:leader peptidase (prepilin peptidase) / N-methyltransferase